MPTAPVRVLVVGQTPPPFGGQAVMIEKLLQGHFTRVQLFHVRLAFSDDMESVGKFGLKKVWVLFTTILRIWVARFRTGARLLYYPPSGPNMVPVLRDLVLLCSTRWLFRHTVFHFHAGGVSTFRPRLPAPFRLLFDGAYRRHALAIRTSALNPDDGAALGARHSIVVPNGIDNMQDNVQERTALPGEPLKILFTGVLIPSKGVRVLLEAFKELVVLEPQVKLEIMGKWGDAAFRDECTGFVRQHDLGDKVEFLGVLSGDAKWQKFASCDIFCFPSYFEAESFGLVIAEAMQFGKPVVSTHWRGIPSVVEDGRSGLLVPVQDAHAVAEALQRFVRDPVLRKSMGEEGRRIFLRKFTLEAFHRNMEDALASVEGNERITDKSG
ncbi:MAG: glycosyltransferase family 4 protein [Flavobacteriales bacterium]|nr:MAG: glycosyltransferase family 4 protein [Flavobacteriales bacterium]